MNAKDRAAATGRPWWFVARDAVLRGIGLTAGDRGSIVDGIVMRHGKEALTYWLQLAIATGIATLGVVLNSTAVVIGAMLISPLMEPIVGFGMALAVGAPILAVRSTYRLAVSIATVVGASALLTLLLPFHEVTPEIAARTSPTLLDLGVAVFCAISAAFTTLRRSSDTVSTAAGTAIGIALVPPLCVVGFGLGAGLPVVARGAALLFTANLAAIILVSTVLFILAGFGTAQSTVEADEESASGLTARLARGLHAMFGSRAAPLVKVMLPVAFVATILLPLRRALHEVSWDVRVRSATQRIIAEVAPSDRSVRTVVTVAHGAVFVRLVVLGRPARAQTLEAELRRRILAETGVTPAVHVIAVPDADTLHEAAREANAPVPIAVEPHRPDVAAARTLIDLAVQQHWPAAAVGRLLSWRLEPSDDGTRIEFVHLGAPLGRAGELLLSTALEEPLEVRIDVRDVAFSPTVSDAQPGAIAAWLPSLSRALWAVQREPLLVACVTAPPIPTSPDGGPFAALPGASDASDPIARALLEQLRSDRVHVTDGDHWRVGLAERDCPEPPPALSVTDAAVEATDTRD